MFGQQQRNHQSLPLLAVSEGTISDLLIASPHKVPMIWTALPRHCVIMEAMQSYGICWRVSLHVGIYLLMHIYMYTYSFTYKNPCACMQVLCIVCMFTCMCMHVSI